MTQRLSGPPSTAPTQRFPDDPEIAVLSIDAIMNLSPWDYWEADGKTSKGQIGDAVRIAERGRQRRAVVHVAEQDEIVVVPIERLHDLVQRERVVGPFVPIALAVDGVKREACAFGGGTPVVATGRGWREGRAILL